MAGIKFTHDQLLAINSEGSDILVSAAAGSGKTAVLTRRVLNKIIDTRTPSDITDFLVVTFTVSAASDLKRKLSQGIRDEMKNKGADTKRLRRQLLSLSYAKIATIDSFCHFIVKDCDTLSLPVGMTLGDENEIAALALEIMEECVENAFVRNEGDDSFLALVETFSNSRGDAALVPSLLSLYNHVLRYPEPIKLLEEYVSECENAFKNKDSVPFFDTVFGRGLKEDINEKLCQVPEWLESAARLCELDADAFEKYLPVIESDIAFVNTLKSAALTSYESFAHTVSDYQPLPIPSIRGKAHDELFVKIKSLRAEAKDTMVSLGKTYLVKSEEEIFLQLELHARILKSAVEVISEFHERFSEEKRRRKIMGFPDMSHYAFKALIEEGSYNRKTGEFVKTPYAEQLTSRFREILIDEYQDVNELQDTIFRAISNSKNRFMVGDIKQSIYAFRGAVPEIFAHLRDTFKLHTDENDKSCEPKLIFLQNNFRSDSSVLDFSNKIFSRLMNWNSEKYLEKDRLVFSKGEDALHPVEFTVFHRSSRGEDKVEGQEEAYIANKITSLVSSGDCRLSDIAVIARTAETLEKVSAALDTAQIPYDTSGGANLFDSYEVLTAISFLKAVRNPTDDVSLAAALSSSPFSFTPDELLEIRSLDKNTDLYFALVKASERDNALAERCRAFIQFLDSLLLFSQESSPDRVLWRIMEETRLFTSIEKMSSPKARRDNLLSLFNLSRTLCRGEKGSLGTLCDKLDTLARDGKVKGAGSAPADSVKLMTYHGSKGLEFPVAFVAGLGREINRQDSHTKIIFSPFGPTFDLPFLKENTRLASYLRKSAARLTEKDIIDEELRGLYVALTRAQSRLFVTAEADVKSLKKKIETSSLSDKSFSYSVKHAPSLVSLITMALSEEKGFVEAFDPETDSASVNCGSFITSVIKSEKEIIPELFINKEKKESALVLFESDVKFALRNTGDTERARIPYKISVSRLKEGLLDEGQREDITLAKAPRFASPETTASAAFRGTSMHTFMQFCSFDLYSEDEVEREADRLVREGFITEEMRESLDIPKLFSLLSSDVFDRIRKSRLVEREKRYTVSVPVHKFVPAEKYPHDDNILIQGVVDCYFEEEDSTYTLIDFKTDRVRDEETLTKRHREQLLLYAEALSEILPKRIKKILIYSFELSKFIEI